MLYLFGNKMVRLAFAALISTRIIACCNWDVTSDGGASEGGGSGVSEPIVSTSSSGGGSGDCGQGGAGGVGEGGSGGQDNFDDSPWGNSCDWCNGPGCEELDRPCQDVESGSRGVTCYNPEDTLGPEDHCFGTYDTYHWNRPVLCCCEPGVCPGV